MIDMMARKRKIEVAEDSGFLAKNKMIIGIVIVLVVAAVLLSQLNLFPTAGTGVTTTTVPKITSQKEAGDTVSDLTSSAADLGSFLADIDNSIG